MAIRIHPEVKRDVLDATQSLRSYRINFDSKRQMRDFREYYHNCTAEFKREYSLIERTVIVLSLLGWSRRKIIAKTYPRITEYQLNKVYIKMPWLTRSVRILRKATTAAVQDAMQRIVSSIDMNGEIIRLSK
jgi:hypothetical protein